MEQIIDWNKADSEGTINVPDYLDEMINKVGMQLRFHKHSGKNEAQTICDIVYGLETFFEKLYTEKPSRKMGDPLTPEQEAEKNEILRLANIQKKLEL